MHSYVLPIMQGFVGQRELAAVKTTSMVSQAAPNKDDIELAEKSPDSVEKDLLESADTKVLATLVSRRSIKRAGLRYLRRGIDEAGNVANAVETEQILSTSDQRPRHFSFTQYRGSIPLYFSQSPYSFKPKPQMRHSREVNQTAFNRHFKLLKEKYGHTSIALLVDKGSVEAPIGQEYESLVRSYIEDKKSEKAELGFHWFDFHHECQGMKFENVSILVQALRPTIEDFGLTSEEDGALQKTQSGIIRTNCMDCLDRTNVVQSALGREVLQRLLDDLDIAIDLHNGPNSLLFNVLWADNGDAISKQYSGTAALKGDYTRTSKRNYQGAINDFSLTLSRCTYALLDICMTDPLKTIGTS